MKMLCNVKRAWSKSGRAESFAVMVATCGRKHDLPVNLRGSTPGTEFNSYTTRFWRKREKKLGRGKRGRRVKRKEGKKREEEKGFS